MTSDPNLIIHPVHVNFRNLQAAGCVCRTNDRDTYTDVKFRNLRFGKFFSVALSFPNGNGGV